MNVSRTVPLLSLRINDFVYVSESLLNRILASHIITHNVIRVREAILLRCDTNRHSNGFNDIVSKDLAVCLELVITVHLLQSVSQINMLLSYQFKRDEMRIPPCKQNFLKIYIQTI